MKKWFLLKISYNTDFSDDTLVEFVEESKIEDLLPNIFDMSDSYGLEIYELSSGGEKIERSDLSRKIIEGRNKNFYESLN